MHKPATQTYDTTSYWSRWITVALQGDAKLLLRRTIEETYNKIVLNIYAIIPQDVLMRKKDGFDPREHEWFSREPHLSSGYAGYDGRCGWCGSRETTCTSFGIGGIALGVDEGSADIICNAPVCGRYTRMEYSKDSS